MPIRVVSLDYDGTLVNSSSRTFSEKAIARIIKSFCFRFCRPFYTLGEIAEAIFLRIRWPLHRGAKEFIGLLKEQGFIVGIVTDRTLYTCFVKSVGLEVNLNVFDFIHARKSWFNRLVSIPEGVTVLLTDQFKGDENALEPLLGYMVSCGFSPPEVFLVGDDDRDVAAAIRHGFEFIKVNRFGPNFAEIYARILNLNSTPRKP